MPKKRKLFSNFDPDDELEFDPAEEPPFDDDLDDDDDFDLDDPSEGAGNFTIFEADIIDDCGPGNARRGLALFQRGAVNLRSFDGHAIRAQVSDETSGRDASSVQRRSAEGEGPSAGVADVSYDFDELEHQCSCLHKDRGPDFACAHVAALQYAWMREPQSFALKNLGAALELATQHPEIVAGTGLNLAALQTLAEAWESAPPALRESIARTPMNPTPEQSSELEAQLNAYSAQERDRELAGLLDRFTLDQLRTIAKRRRWTLRSTSKTKAIAELVDQLRASPLPDTFSPEEEQLVRIENTLWGLEHMPSHHNLQADWQAHAGGNVARLEHALQGLQSAGVLFPCTGEGMGLHYHWSPFLTTAILPLLQPNVALAPAKAAAALASGQDASSVQRRGAEGGGPSASVQAPFPLLALLDAVLTFAERETLRLRARPYNPKLVGYPWIGQWQYEPEEVRSLTGARRRMPAALTVPFAPFFADDTLDALGALAGGAREYGAWAAALLVQAGIIQPAGTIGPASMAGVPPVASAVVQEAGELLPAKANQAVVNAVQASAWRALAPDQQYRRLWQLWCAGVSTFGDFRMALQNKSFIVRRSMVDPEFSPQALAEDMGLARQLVARVLAMLAPQTWYAWPAFAGYVRKLRSGFPYSFTDHGLWWIEHAPSARRYDAKIPQEWEAAYLPLLQTMLTGALYWFGAIELTYSSGQDAFHPLGSPLKAAASLPEGAKGHSVQRRGAEGRGSSASGHGALINHQSAINSRLSAFRITPLGAWLFTEGRQGHAPVFAPSAADDDTPFVWLDEITFRAPATPVAMRTLASLRAYAEPAREMLTFRVSPAAVAHALLQGADPPSIVDAFAEAGLPLADALAARIAALASSVGRLNLYERMTVLELGDDFVLRELLATTALRAHIIHQFSPRLVVVRDEAVDELVAELVKKGHTPLVT